MDPTEQYIRLGQLVSNMPLITAEKIRGSDPELLRWLGDAYALAQNVGDLNTQTQLQTAMNDLHRHSVATGFSFDAFVSATRAIPMILYRLLSMAEIKAPAQYRGGFIPAQSPLDAITAFRKVVTQQTNQVLIVDAYLDTNALTDFAVQIPETVHVRLLTGKQSKKAGFAPAVSRFITQYGAERPLEAKEIDSKELHDRLIILDSSVWIMTQSLNGIAARSPATIYRFEDLDNFKRNWYENLWSTGQPIT